jgi:uncharacterized membrane protein HdeD (DUF308 family)
MPWVHLLFLVGGIFVSAGLLSITVLVRHSPNFGKILVGAGILSLLFAAVIAVSSNNLGTQRDDDCVLCGRSPQRPVSPR